MLEPRSAIGASAVADPLDRSSAAIAATSSSARSSIAPSLAPWPRWSNASAPSPARQRRAGEVVVVLLARAGAVEDHDPAGGRGLDLGIHSEYESPSRAPISRREHG